MTQTPNSSKKTKNDSQGRSGLNDYIKYTGMGFQMLVIIGIFTWIGTKLDAKSEGNDKLFTALFALVGVIVGIYNVLKDFIKPKNDT